MRKAYIRTYIALYSGDTDALNALLVWEGVIVGFVDVDLVTYCKAIKCSIFYGDF